MRFWDYLALALRSLRRSRLRSGLTIAAIVVGATGVTIMLTFVTSVKNYIVDQFVQTGEIRQIQVGQNADLTFDPSGQSGGGGGAVAAAPTGASGSSGPAGGPVTLSPALEAQVGAIPHVTGVAAVLAQGGDPAIQSVSFGNQQAAIRNLVGYEPNGVIKSTLVAGHTFAATDTANAVLITRDYADALGFKGKAAQLVGKSIDLHTAAGYTGVGVTLPDVLPPQIACQPGPNRACNGGPASGLPAVTFSARVVGIVDPAHLSGVVYLPLPWMIGLLDQAQPKGVRYSGPTQPGQPGQPPQVPTGPGVVVGGWGAESPEQFVADRGGYQSFVVDADREGNVTAVAAAIKSLGVNAATGIAQLDDQKSKADTVALILGGLGLVALGIAALGVMNTMVMSVLQRTREIGVMRAVGARRATIRRLFTFEAAALGFFGGLFGVVIGYVFVLVAKPAISNAVKSSPIKGASFTVPLWLVVLVIGGTTVVGLASGFLPARRAARLDPVEALRYE